MYICSKRQNVSSERQANCKVISKDTKSPLLDCLLGLSRRLDGRASVHTLVYEHGAGTDGRWREMCPALFPNPFSCLLDIGLKLRLHEYRVVVVLVSGANFDRNHVRSG